MTREAVIVELGPNGGAPVRYACNDSDAIAKGTLLFIDEVGVRKVSGANLLDSPAAGIAAAEKVAADGQLFISVYTEGIFDLMVGAAACTIGSLLKISGANYVVSTNLDDVMSGNVLCKALEVGTAKTTIACKLVMV